MNAQVNSEAPAATAPAAPAVAVAETAPVALTPVAAAVAAPAAPRAKSVADDFVDDEDEPVLPTATAEAEEQEESSDTVIAEFEDGDQEQQEDGAVRADAGGEDVDALSDLDEVTEDAEDGEQSMVVIDVYKRKCTDCTHLVPWGTKTHKRCHFSNGNEQCPAQSVRIRRYIPVDQIVARFLAADAQGDTDRLVTLYENLRTKAPDVQEEIHAALKAAREKKVLRAIQQ